MTVESASLSVRNLSWGIAGRAPIISGISFEVAPRDVLAIVGPNGAGKSSLLRCLYRSNKPDSGQVLIDGRDLWALSARAAALRIAVVLQEATTDFPFLVRDVVAMGRIPHRSGLSTLGDHDRAVVDAALDRLELMPFRDRVFSSLSGGEKQRVLVARALAQEPGVIILDEPTNHLDIRHQLDILGLLRALQLTVVTTLHDLNLAAGFADRLLLMSGGHVIGAGGPGEVLTPDAVARAFDVETCVDAHPTTLRPRFSFHLPQRGRPGDLHL